jgi:hypothetical protein
MWSAGHNWGGDFASYIMQSIAISDGDTKNFFLKNSLTMSRSSNPLGPVNYPWGFPIMLAPFYKFFGLNIFLFKTLILASFICFLAIIWNIFKNEFDTYERLIYVSIFAFNPYLLEFSNQILSDIPFLLFSTLSVYLLIKLQKEKSINKAILISIVLGVCFMWSTAIRTSGILLPFTYTIYLLLTLITNNFLRLRKLNLELLTLKNFSIKERMVIYLLPLIFFFLSNWYMSEIMINDQTIHYDFLRKISIKTIFTQAVYNLIIIKNFFGSSYLNIILYIFSLPFVFIGLKKKWSSSIFIIIYVGAILGLYTIWPFRQGLRFLIPLLPFYIYFFIVGIRSISDFNSNSNLQSRKLIGNFLIVVFFLTSLLQINLNYKNNFRLVDGPYNDDSTEMFDFIKKNVSQTEIVVFRKPRVMTLLTNKYSIMYNDMKDFVEKNWYVVDKKNTMNINLNQNNLFKKYPASIYFENKQFIVYKFD